MSEKKKKEAAVKILRGISDWDPSEPCAFEMSHGAEFRAGPISCVTLGRRHRFLILGVDYTQEMSDLMGLGLRSAQEDGVSYKTFSGNPERELLEWSLRLAQDLAEPAEGDNSQIAKAVRSGRLKARLIWSAAGFVGRSASKSPEGEYERNLANLLKENQADCSCWSLNRKGFERALMEASPDWSEAFYETLGEASPRALMDLARLASEPQWWERQAKCQSLARRLAEMGCALSHKSERAADLFESAGMGEIAALLQARELRESLAPKGAPAPARGPFSL